MGKWVIYGGGGHASVLADLVKQCNGQVMCYFDDNAELARFKGVPVTVYHENTCSNAKLLIGIGNNEVRLNVSKYIFHELGVLIHPQATVADDVVIGEGTVILAGAVIQSGSVIGKHVVINANVTVDHDVNIGDFCNIYPNSYIGGGTRIGNGVVIEACTSIPRLTHIADIFSNDDLIQLDSY